MVTIVTVTPPDEAAISLEDAKRHLRVDHSDDDDYIESLVEVATAHLSGPDGWLGRCLLQTVLELRLDNFCESIQLPLPPYVEMVSVKYDDANGTEQTFAADNYRVIGGASPALILKSGKSWPATNCQPECVRIQYKSGYGTDGEDVPAPIRQAMLLMIAHWYENREAVVMPTGTSPVELPIGAERLLTPFRIY